MDAAWIFPGLGWTESGWTATNCSVYANRDVANATAAGYGGRNAGGHDSNHRAAGGLYLRVPGSDARRATGTDQEEDRRVEEMKYRIDESLCVGCGLCVNVCPVRAITMADTAQINIDSCTGCGTCAGVCKTGAIIEVPDLDKPVQETAPLPAVVASGVATAIGALGDAVKRYASSSSPTGSRRGGGMGRGGGRGSGSGGGRGGGGRGMNKQNKRRR